MFLNILKFIFKSTNQHGVHSPFVYQLVTECFYKKTNNTVKTDFLKYKEKLTSNFSEIDVLDLGPGSKTLNTKKRQVARIAKAAAIPMRYAFLMNRVVKYLNVENVLELGTSLGTSTYAMLLENNIKIDTIEGCPETLKIAQKSLKNLEENINFFNGDFKEELKKISVQKKYDLIFFDGNHQKQPTIDYFEECLKHKHNDTVFVFDDIYWSKEMEEAWSFIKNHKEVLVTVDVFKFGFVFFREEQVKAKEHFKIRVW